MRLMLGYYGTQERSSMKFDEWWEKDDGLEAYDGYLQKPDMKEAYEAGQQSKQERIRSKDIPESIYDSIMLGAKAIFLEHEETGHPYAFHKAFEFAMNTIKKYKDLDAHKHLIAIGNAVQKGWKSQAQKHHIDLSVATGMAPLCHFTFNYPDMLEIKSYFIQLMVDCGFLASNLFYAMYAHTEDHVKRYLDAAGRAFLAIRETLDKGDLEQRLMGQSAAAGFIRIS